LAAASFISHSRNAAPSTVLAIILFLDILCSSTHFRTLVYLRPSSVRLLGVYATFLAVRIAQLVTELIEKRRLLKPSHVPQALEPTSSIVSRITFVFLLPLLWFGRRTALDLDTLCTRFGLPPAMACASAGLAFSQKLSESRKTKEGIIRISWRAFWTLFLAPVPPKLVYIAATFAQPYVVQTLLYPHSGVMVRNVHPFPEALFSLFVSERNQAARGSWLGTGRSLCSRISFNCCQHCILLGQGLCDGHCLPSGSVSKTTCTLYVCDFKAFLGSISAIFDKTLRLTANVAQTEGSGAAVTYMYVFCLRF
jgi:ATP-binding cassette, subfamily C (CFTR/MRP), member 1